jgi:biopolymer transport protein ExbB
MKLASTLLALLLGATALHGLEPVRGPEGAPVLLAQAGTAAKRDTAVTSINDRGAAEPAPVQAAPDDTFAIKTGPPKKEEDSGVNLWELVKSGGWVMIVLGVLSVIALMLIIAFLFTLRRGAILTPHFMNTADVLLKKRDYLGLLAISSRHSEVVARIVQRTLDFATKNPAASFEMVREIAETEGGSQAASLQHRVTFLADIGVLSPMVGLLGTVVGIIRAFAKLGSGDQSLSRDFLLANGISMALVATAAGLFLGISCMIFYAIFRNRAQSLISDMEIASTHILAMLGAGFGKKREAASRVPVEDEF